MGAIAFGLAGSMVPVLNSCSTTPGTLVAPPDIPGATFLGNKACAECRNSITHGFPASAHARIQLEDARAAGQTGCESCHGPASLHISGGGGRGKFIINPRKDPAACFECHRQEQEEFQLPQHHPVLEGKMNCVQCHDPHGSDIHKLAGGLAMARLNQACAQCHREQTRPVVFEHPALREGCTVCHNPHGSINAKLLIQRRSEPLPPMPCASPGPERGPRARLYRQERPHHLSADGRLLVLGMPHGGAWFERRCAFAVLGGAGGQIG